MVTRIPVAKIHPHPRNPRLSPRADVIDQIASQIAGGMDDAHALIVRPNCGEYEIISGHHRWLAAQQAGLKELPCWVREMSNDEAYMQLVLCNTQSELHPLEEGIHAIGSGKKQADYVREVKKPQPSVARRWLAAEVFIPCGITFDQVKDSWRNLAEIHAAPEWLWAALVARMIADGWTVETTRKQVSAMRDFPDALPSWMDSPAVAEGLVSGSLKIGDIARMEHCVQSAKVRDEEPERFRLHFTEDLSNARPARLSDAQIVVARWEQIQAEHDAATRAVEIARQREEEQAMHRVSRLRSNCSLDEWKELGATDRAMLLDPDPASGAAFNRQENKDIEWAQWSWNPVTGCRHECSYCYARDIATSQRMASVYPHGFEPVFRSNALLGPKRQKVPAEAATDTRYRNVFTCSMADLFGRWVPSEWIEAVLGSVRDNPQWNFLFLTKFPNRMAEFEIPANAWMGTTVDLQARVKNSEKAFENVRSGVRWLSIEPMLEPLRFEHLDRFDWVVIGGASRSSKTPSWFPPHEWIIDLVAQCRAAGARVYFKSNLFGCDDQHRATNARVLELPFDAPAPADPSLALPDAFRYLGA